MTVPTNPQNSISACQSRPLRAREAVRLGGHADPDAGFAEITNHRTHARPKPPPKAISTIHKAKGLECDGVIVMPCDAKTLSHVATV